MCYRLIPLLWAMPLLTLAALPDNLHTQESPAGALTGTRRVGTFAERCPATSLASVGGGEVEIRRGQHLSTAVPPTDVMFSDILGVRHTIDARMRVTPAFGNGILYFVPGLICHTNIVSPNHVVRGLQLQPAERAVYEIFRDSATVDLRPGERLAVAVESGGLIVEWGPGPPLLVLAAGTSALVRGTTVAIAVDSTGNEGILYVETGTVTLSGFAEDVAPGFVYHLRAGVDPVVIDPEALGTGMVEGLRESLQHHGTSVWAPNTVSRPPRTPLAGGVEK